MLKQVFLTPEGLGTFYVCMKALIVAFISFSLLNHYAMNRCAREHT